MSLSLSNDTYLQCDVIFKIKCHAIFLYWRQLDGVFKEIPAWSSGNTTVNFPDIESLETALS